MNKDLNGDYLAMLSIRRNPLSRSDFGIHQTQTIEFTQGNIESNDFMRVTIEVPTNRIPDHLIREFANSYWKLVLTPM